ncbi:MAG: PqqD family protein [Brachybacterium paraconglomeratum]|nr:PqqD family protein [Brachybacterium paraconglomeratum]
MRELRVPDRVGVVEGASDDDALYVAGLPDGPIVVLRDTALTIWQEAVSLTGEQDLAQRVADVYGVPVGEVREAVEACVADLVGRGVLEFARGT